jgi:hypothetical protein
MKYAWIDGVTEQKTSKGITRGVKRCGIVGNESN